MELTHKFRSISTFLVFLFIYIGNTKYNVEGYMVGNNPYHRAETLDPEGNFLLEWLIDLEGKRVTFNVTVETKGYVGFGLSSYGKMSGADIVIGGVKSDGSSYFSDRHAVGHHTPELDPSQDWVLHSARESKTHTFLSFSRAFDTCDPQDYPITEDKISLIWAYGERDTIQYHYRTRGEYPIYLINPDYAPLITRDISQPDRVLIDGKEQSEIKIWTVNLRLELPAEQTTYWCTFHKAPRLSRKHHSIGFEMRFPTPEDSRYPHHVLVQKCHAPPGMDARTVFDPWTRQPGHNCLDIRDSRDSIRTQYCTDYRFGWAIGGRLFFFSDNVGVPFGESPDEYYAIQVHYNNAERRPGLIVETALDLIYTSRLRPNDAGLMTLRHQYPGLPSSLLVPPSSISHKVYGLCGSACTTAMLPRDGVTIAGVLMHSHNSGVRMRIHHFRGNRELPWIASDDTFHFNFQHFRVLNRPVKVLPGDELVIRCEYDNTWSNGTVVGGFSTSQEMCGAWISYHNRLPDYMLCGSEIDSPEYRQHFLGVRNYTWEVSRLEFVVNSPRRLAGLTISEVSDNHVNWDLNRREELQSFQLSHPQNNWCLPEQYSQARTRQINSESPPLVTYPVNAIPYRPKKSCSFHNI